MASPPPLVVPIILANGSLHFAEIRPAGTAQDVVDALLASSDARGEMLAGMQEDEARKFGWALQRIRVERNGRTWEEDELEGLGDGNAYSFFYPFCFAVFFWLWCTFTRNLTNMP